MLLHRLLWAYHRTRGQRFADRAVLERHQQQQLQQFARRVLVRSPWFAQCATLPFAEWPRMDKRLMMAQFDRMNTAGLRLEQVLACAMQAEATRDFSATVDGYSVGLSSGTSGGRGVFVVSPAEQARWAGVMLAKMLPHGLLHGERVALCLRANNNLYQRVNNPCLSFEFFDSLQPLSGHLARLQQFRPSIVVAPAQILQQLAQDIGAGRLAISPKLVISAAEVLSASDRAALQACFPEVGEVYQATEGFLGATCAHGTLHLNEAFIHVESEWLDGERFVPLITDFSRHTQPVVRYRLDDILLPASEPCRCGNPERAIARIEGRCDDALQLPDGQGGRVTVFADVCQRALAQSLPLAADYRLTQHGERQLLLQADIDLPALQHCRDHLARQLAAQGVDGSALQWRLECGLPASDFSRKRRRISRQRDALC